MDENTESRNLQTCSRRCTIRYCNKNKAEVAQQQAQQTAQDPIVQMQQQELQIKAQETEIKKQKLALDSAAKMDQLEIEKERIAAQERIAGLQVGAKIATDKANLSAKQQEAGLRIGVDVARSACRKWINKNDITESTTTKKGE